MNRMAVDSSVNGTTRSRYPGTRPFTDSADDYARFYGRSAEGEQLYLRVLSVPLTVQFGKSGLGKTSLLQALLFHRLREKTFLPVMIRLNDTGVPLVQAVSHAMQLACLTEKLEFSEGNTEGLWELLSTTMVWREDLLLTPVLVFDQFEEVFTLRDASFRADLAAELGALSSGIAPERLRANAAGVPEQYAVRPNVKIVISLREDYLGALQEFSSAMPYLFHERLRLEPLSEKAAREAITEPAKLTADVHEEPYWSPCFDFEKAALDAMIEYLKGNSGVIEPFQLQLLSRHAEAIAHTKGETHGDPVSLTLEDFAGSKSFSSVLNNFYRDTLDKLPRTQRKKAQALCEEGLLDAAGNRLMLEEKQILTNFHVNANTLAILTQERIIRRERRLESVFYEISHDRLAESIARSRQYKLPKHVKRRLGVALCIFLVIVGSLILRNQAVRTERDLAERARNQAVQARNQAEQLLSFLLGENFLGEVRDGGRSELLEQMQRQVDKTGGNGDQWTALNRGLALRNRGDLKRTKGLVSDSAALFEQALEVFKTSPANFDSQREIARTYQRLGEAYTDLGNLVKSLSHYEASVGAWRQAAAMATESDVKIKVCTDLADNLVLSGDTKNRMGDESGALADFESALKVASNAIFGGHMGGEECAIEKVTDEPYPNAKALEVLSRVYRSRALVLESDEAGFKCAFSLALKAKWVRPTSIAAKQNALFVLAFLGNASLWQKPQRALNNYRKVLEGFDELQRWDPSNQQWQRERAATQLLVSEGIVGCNSADKKDCKPMPSLEEAKALTLDALATLRGLVQIDRLNKAWQSDLVWAMQDHANVLAAQHRYGESLALFKEAERIHRQDFRPSKEDAEGVSRLGWVLIGKSKALAKLKKLREARDDLKSAVDLFEKLHQTYPDNMQFTSWLYSAHLSEKEILQKAGDKSGAIAAENAVKQLSDKYWKIRNDKEKKGGELDNAFSTHRDKGAKLFREGEYPAALKEFIRAEAAMREYICLQPTTYKEYEDLHNIFTWIQQTYQKLGDNEKRATPLEAAMHAAQIAVWLAPEKDVQAKVVRKMLEDRLDLAGFLLGNDSSEKTLEKALAVMQAGVVVAEGFLPENIENASTTGMLGTAKCGQGMIRRHLKKTGWEEVIRSGLIHLRRAGELDKTNPTYPTDEGTSRKFMAQELEADGRIDKAQEEYRLALEAFKRAAKLNPNDEYVRGQIRSLE